MKENQEHVYKIIIIINYHSTFSDAYSMGDSMKRALYI